MTLHETMTFASIVEQIKLTGTPPPIMAEDGHRVLSSIKGESVSTGAAKKEGEAYARQAGAAFDSTVCPPQLPTVLSHHSPFSPFPPPKPTSILFLPFSLFLSLLLYQSTKFLN